MDFSAALLVLKADGIVFRQGWDRHAWVMLHRSPAPNSVAYLYMSTGQIVVPWTPSQIDLMAEDWQQIALREATNDQ
jgi:hypothetical protein